MEIDPIDLADAKVLVVDDTPANLDVIFKVLESQQYQVFVAVDGKTALDIASKEQPDLILLDVGMPDMDGFGVCRQLKERPALSKIPVIFLTAYQDQQDMQNGFEVGGVDYITKPFNREALLRCVRTHLENVFLRRALEERIRNTFQQKVR